MKCLWMAVTADKYELPLVVEPTAGQLARKLKVTKGTVTSSVVNKNNGAKSGRKIIKINLE